MRWGRLLLFVLVGLVFHTCAYVAYTRPVKEGHKAVRSDRAFFRAPDRIDLLVLGDSHPRTGIDPRLLGDRVVNAALGGEHYLKNWYRMRALLEHTGKDVGAILLPFDAASFSSWHATNFAPEYVWGRYVDFIEVGRITGDPSSGVERLLKAHVVPYAGELRTINQLRTKRFGFGEDLPTGMFSNLSEGERRYQARQAAAEHLKGKEVLDPGLRWAFDHMLGWARERGVRVVLVAFPVTDDYDHWVAYSGARERIHAEVLAPLLAEGEVTFLDFHDLFGARDEFFSDPHHLNTAGRVAFSKRLRDELVRNGILR